VDGARTKRSSKGDFKRLLDVQEKRQRRVVYENVKLVSYAFDMFSELPVI
jgi:hypothetical protein